MMTMMAEGEDDEDDDEYVWRGTAAPSLERVDAALRCPSCKGYFEAHVGIKCGHHFCSACIREWRENTCPICRAPNACRELTPNRTIHDMVMAFKQAKKEIMAAIGRPKEGGDGSAAASLLPAPALAEPRRRVESCGSDSSNNATSQKKNKRRMPALVYHTYKTPELKRMLKKLGLPSSGDRTSLIWRHKEYSKLHNAACDNFDPQVFPDPGKICSRVRMKEKTLKGGASNKTAKTTSLASGFSLLAAQIKKRKRNENEDPAAASPPKTKQKAVNSSSSISSSARKEKRNALAGARYLYSQSMKKSPENEGDDKMPPTPADEKGSASSWSCSACTYLNQSNATRCEVCLTVKPRAPSSRLQGKQPEVVEIDL